jgi:phosphatidylglycerol lysyltransferase
MENAELLEEALEREDSAPFEFSYRASRLKRLAQRVREHGLIWLVAALTFANGVASLAQMLLVRFRTRHRVLGMVLPFGIHHWNRTLTVVFGFTLIYLSLNLLQRRRVAWAVVVMVLLATGLVHITRGDEFGWHISAASLGTALLLILSRDRFTVRSEPRSIARGAGLLVLSLLIALTYGTLGFFLLEERDFGLDFNLSDALLRTLREFTLIGNSDLTAHTRHARWFLESLRVLGLVTAVFGLYSLFRPLAYRLRTLPHERAAAKTILEKYGRSPIDYFKLWPDKSYYFSDDQSSFVAYKTAWNVAVSLGDPVGPVDHLEGLTRGFMQFCFDNGWTTAFHQVLPDLLPMYRRLEFNVLKLGEDAIVDLEKFRTETARNRNFRHAKNRLEKEGYTLARYLPPHPRELLDEVEDVSDEWLTLPGRRERGFTLGQFRHDYVNETPLFVLKDPGGRILAFVNEVPAYRPGRATVDMMRHRVEIPNGAMDYLFLGLLLTLHEAGYSEFDLGLAPFTGVGDRPGANFEERTIYQLSQRLNRFFSYKGLRHYKAKFEPSWEDAYLVYQGGPPGLLKTAIALSRVTEL